MVDTNDDGEPLEVSTVCVSMLQFVFDMRVMRAVVGYMPGVFV